MIKLIANTPVKGIAHITGGGFIENIPRVFPEGLGCDIRLGNWDVPPVFDVLRKAGKLEDKQMYNTFNMGCGMVLALSPEKADEAVREANALGEKAFIIGEVTGSEGVNLI